jgi:hypothetical protein
LILLRLDESVRLSIPSCGRLFPAGCNWLSLRMGLSVDSRCHHHIFVTPSRKRGERKSVLVLTQGNGRQQSFIEFTAGLQQTLAANLPKPPVFYIENLDMQNFNSPDHLDALIEWLRIKYQDRKLDAIVTENEQTAEFPFMARSQLWPLTPLVFVDSGRVEVKGIAAETN